MQARKERTPRTVDDGASDILHPKATSPRGCPKCRRAEGDNDGPRVRAEKIDEPVCASLDRPDVRSGSRVWLARDRVGDEELALIQPSFMKRAEQDFSRGPDEGPTLHNLLLTGSFPDDNDPADRVTTRPNGRTMSTVRTALAVAGGPSPILELDRSHAAAHSSDSTSACSRTVRVACSCLSGG
jgi:hypothetical protein